MQHAQLIRGKWRLGLHHSEKLLLVQITDEVNVEALLKILLEMLEDFPVILVSQYIDMDQLRIKDRVDFVNGLMQRHPVDTHLTASYEESDASNSAARIFIVNVMGAPSRELLADLIKFGMTSLSNIVYASDRTPDSWRTALLSWNERILKWFRLAKPEDEKVLVDLVNERRLIAMTVDGHLCFWLTELASFHKLLRILEALAGSVHLKLELSPVDIWPHPGASRADRDHAT